MKPILAAVWGLGVLTAHLAAQSTSAPGLPPERLMVGPAEYLPSPHPFPLSVPATASSLDLTRARNLAPRVWGMAHALPCRPVAATDTTGWVPITIGSDIGPAVLPSAFAQDTTFRSYHGGLKWAAPGMVFSIENGWWGVPYDSAGYLTACRVKARAGEYLVNESRTPTGYSFTAIPWNPTWGPSTMISAQAMNEESLRILWTAFVSMVPPECRYMTGAPTRDATAPAC
ncbi:MAG: hypothetical protein ABJE47_22900 [bacterium]